MQPSPRVLFVDDEPHVLAAIMRQLRRELDIVTACGAAAGLAELSLRPFTVVVADMQMPEMDGITFLRQARQIQPEAVRVVLTGNADQTSVQRAIEEADIFRYLSKPCRPETLLATLREAIDRYAA